MDALVYRWRKPYSFITIRDSSTYIGALHPQCITYKKKRTRGDGPTTKKNTGGGRTNKMEYVQGATYKNIIHERGQYKRYNTCMEGAQKSIFLMHKVLYVSDFCYLSLSYSGLLTSRDFGYIFLWTNQINESDSSKIKHKYTYNASGIQRFHYFFKNKMVDY